MSRIGKQPIKIPEGVQAKMADGILSIKGSKGELAREFKDSIKIELENDFIKLTPKTEDKNNLALWGTYASLVKNMIKGVTDGFSKKLIIEGVGFKAQKEGNDLVLNLGFSHPVRMPIPEGININVEKEKIEISGIDKEKVGGVAAKIRDFKKPEPYKGKGIRYEGEVIRRKAGKKAAGAA